MDIDERIKYLVTSTESLHDSCQHLHAAAEADRKRAEEDRIRAEAAYAEMAKQQRAILAAIRAYLEGMGGET